MQAGTVSRPRYAPPGAFWTAVRAGAERHLAGRVRVADGAQWRKAALILSWFLGSYAVLLTSSGLPMRVIAAVSMGAAAAGIGFNIFHDATHGAFFVRPGRNLWLARAAAALLGADRHFWQAKHHVLHHSFANIWQWDDDLETRGWLRMTRHQPWRPRHRHQHVYAVALYGLNSLEWFFIKDFVQYRRCAVNPYQPVAPLSPAQRLEFWLTKAVYLGVMVVPPFLVMPPAHAAIAFIAFHATLGVILTFVFQLAHLTDVVRSGAMLPGDDWAQHQMRTTANFATRNRLACWYMGGLNYQIEHHLFPQVSHCHYSALAGIVREAALRHGMPYHHLGGFRDALRSHFGYLRTLATAPDLAGSSNDAAAGNG